MRSGLANLVALAAAVTVLSSTPARARGGSSRSDWSAFLRSLDASQATPHRCRDFLLPAGGAIADWGRDRVRLGIDRLRKTFLSTDGKIRGATKAAAIDPLGEYDGLWIRDNAVNVHETLIALRDWARDQSPAVRTATEADADRIEEAYVAFCRSNLAQDTLGRNGEPKFNADGTPFNKPWGRPQNDGAGYRALRWMEYVDRKLAKGLRDEALKNYDPDLNRVSLKWDLEYVAHHWRDPSFDLWEEEMGSHFHTLVVMMDALEKGAKLAARLEPEGEKSAAAAMYRDQARKMRELILTESWDPATKRLRSTWRHAGGFVSKQEPLDISLIIGLLHTSSEPPVYALSNEHVMAYMTDLEERFGGLYAINDRFARPGSRGVVAIGRYPEDVFHGGNSWVIATQAAAEYYFKLGAELRVNGEIVVTEWNERFFRRLMEDEWRKSGLVRGARIRKGSVAFDRVLQAIGEKGDGFLEIIRQTSAADGFTAEQIARGMRDGDQGPWVGNYLRQFNGDLDAAKRGGGWVGAQLLIWNEASLLSAWRARSNFLGISGLKPL